ncbi:hypothetical protein HOLleu_44867 [Holothuria leucospilota]|uniref:Uncharacterized protein n=1 Tax=Holothuria leucospilota TaxID=206669 RepID=A0A9Q0Y8J4_HOLLE|nr:hypothetical protein HOLleu_44867 [Holothuria leucospilota]
MLHKPVKMRVQMEKCKLLAKRVVKEFGTEKITAFLVVKREWLSLHQKTCGPRHGREKLRRAQSAAKMMIPENVSTEGVTDNLRVKVLSRMQSDDITADVRRDSDILVYGSRLMRSHPDEHQALLVSQKMRDLAKLVRAAHKKDPSILGIRQCIDPNKSDTVVAAVRIVAGYSEET